MNTDDEFANIVREFLIECHSELDRLDNALVALEQQQDGTDLIDLIFRALHTIKGSAGMLGFARLSAIAHEGETQLDALRHGELALSEALVSDQLALVDAIRVHLACIEQTGSDATLPEAEPNAMPPAGEPTSSAAGPTASAALEATDSTLRVDVSLLDHLMSLVGELVLTRNQIVQLVTGVDGAGLQKAGQRLNLVTSELQEGLMKVRMQPIGNIWNAVPRLVRDVSTACGKQVRLEMDGRETGLDKTILEAIRDPLTHLVRNAVDHGIETPDDRHAAGKPSEGLLHLRASHEGGQVIIEIADDGAGLHLDRIRQRALDMGLETAEHLATMGDRDAAHLIFRPGFSTAAAVTNISGRGVGMDVVKTNVERIGGTIDIQTQSGVGTTFKLKIPLTLAIIPSLVVTCGGMPYALPQVNLVELIFLEGERARQGIDWIHQVPVFRRRGKLLPLVYLNEVLGVPAMRQTTDDETLTIVVLQAEGRRFGLIVEDIADSQEIVVKPLGKELKDIPLYAGATVMGDGRAALILDIVGLGQSARVVGDGHERTDDDSMATANTDQTRQTLLLLAEPGGGRMAVPLSQVARLEELPVRDIERVGGREMIQHRGAILPLLRMEQVLTDHYWPNPGGQESVTGTIQVVVYRHDGRSIGLVVSHIMDIADEEVGDLQPANRDCILGSTVIQGHITELLDLPAVIRRGAPDIFADSVQPLVAGRSR